MYKNALLIFVAVACLAVLPGCGPKASPTGQVTGKVMLKGTPVTTGTISLYSFEKGTGVSSEFDAQGNFTIQKVPVGKYGVTLDPPIPEIVIGGPPKKTNAIEIPAKYTDTQSSGLSIEVKEGDNRLDLDLK